MSYTNPGIVNLSGSYERYVNVVAPDTSSIGSVNFRREEYRTKYTKLLTGRLNMSDVGESGFAGSNPFTQPATIPSWTQSQVGVNHSFVSQAVSSSQYETRNLNCYFSGTVVLETTPIPASGSLFYEKQIRLVTKTYKVSASLETALLTRKLSATGSIFTGATASFVPISGVFCSKHDYDFLHWPQQAWAIPINVPDFGRLRDIKVWVEILSDPYSSNTPATGTFGQANGFGLGCLSIGLRSPSLQGFYGIPSWNDPRIVPSTNPGENITDYTNLKLIVPSSLADPANHDILEAFKEFYRNTFVLWDSGAYWNFTANVTSGSNTFGSGIRYGSHGGGGNTSIDVTVPVWDTDRHIRTVFSDGSTIPNPRHVDQLYDSNVTQIFPESVLSGNSPCVVGGALTGTNEQFGYGRAWGGHFPWFADSRVKGLNIPSVTGTVPNGWLTGPGSTAAPGEFDTKGMNLGPTDIRPVYPLLDTIREVSFPPPSGSYPSTVFTGIRPGLRGSEINGTWWLVVMDRTGYNGGSFDVNGQQFDGCWFRQARLEITYDSNRSSSETLLSKSRRFKKTNVGLAPRRLCMVRDAVSFMSISGSANYTGQGFRHNLCMVFTDFPDVYGRSVGITDRTGSVPNFAVFTRLTGALADRLYASASLGPGSGTAHAIYSYLNNPFGTPYIPLSSGSSIGESSQFFIKEDAEAAAARKKIFSILNPRPIVSSMNTIDSFRSRSGIVRSLRDRVQQILAPSVATSASSS